jgi:hypothetical protein
LDSNVRHIKSLPAASTVSPPAAGCSADVAMSPDEWAICRRHLVERDALTALNDLIEGLPESMLKMHALENVEQVNTLLWSIAMGDLQLLGDHATHHLPYKCITFTKEPANV